MDIKVETEKKFYCSNINKLIKYALEMNFIELNTLVEIDEYFNDINNTYIENRTCFRIRKTNNQLMEITYKGKSNELEGFYCKLENNIKSDIKEYDNYINLFQSLGYFSYVEVIKERKIYELKSDKYKYSIMIDILPNIGSFIEFEIISSKEKSNINELKEELDKLISKFKEINLSEVYLPYRDIVANYIHTKLIKGNEDTIYINIDNEILNIEKDFYKFNKKEISEIYNTSLNWNTFKELILNDKFIKLINKYLDNIILDKKELIILFKLLKYLKYKVYFYTELNEVFFKELLNKFNNEELNIINKNEINKEKSLIIKK